jgi:hypothetical protein
LDAAGFPSSFPQESSPPAVARGMKFADGPLPLGKATAANARQMPVDCRDYLPLL